MKQLVLMGVSLFLFGCGVIGAPFHHVSFGLVESDVDISNSFNVATIRGELRHLITTSVSCRIDQPVKTKKLTFDAGRMRVAVTCAAYGKSFPAYFDFEAIPGHDYLIHMNITPWNRYIDLHDMTDNGSVIERAVFRG